jgi:hypothetical protein
VPYEEAARQMATAYRNFLQPPDSITWNFATRRQAQVRLGGDLGLIPADRRRANEIPGSGDE